MLGLFFQCPSASRGEGGGRRSREREEIEKGEREEVKGAGKSARYTLSTNP